MNIVNCKRPYWLTNEVTVTPANPPTFTLEGLADCALSCTQIIGCDSGTGHQVLAKLIPGYHHEARAEQALRKVYPVEPTFPIHGHFKLEDLKFIASNWRICPESFRTWARDKLLHGLGGSTRHTSDHVLVPALNCFAREPKIDWFYLGAMWFNGRDYALRGPLQQG